MSPSGRLPVLPSDVIPDDIQAVLAFVVAFAAAWYATPIVIRACKNFGIVDRPDGRLKNHAEPVPCLGGLAVGIGVLVSLGVSYHFEHQVLATLLGATIVMVLGLLDDLGSLRPWAKLAGQLLAALVLVKAGVHIQLEFLPSWVAVPLTVLWILAVTNAVNLLDILDGLASGVAAVAALGFAAIAWDGGAPSSVFVAVALAGSLIGFRRFNAHPARIYLGDTGSLLVGFLLAAIAILNDYTARTPVGALAPVVVLGVPLIDMLFVMIVRRRKGIPVMQGSPDHLALRMRRAGLSVATTARVGWLASGGLAVAGVVMSRLPSGSAWLLFGVTAGLGIAAATVFGRIGSTSRA